MFFKEYTEKLWGRHPKDISADWGAQRVKGLSFFVVIKNIFQKSGYFKKKKKIETSLIEEFYYPKYGVGQFWEVVAREIEDMGGKIIKKARVCRIEAKDKKIYKLVYLENGEREIEVEADIVISTMPIKDLVAAIAYAPKPMLKIAQGLPYRDFVIVGLLLDKIYLKNKVPDCWLYIQGAGVKLGRIQIFNNWSPYLVKDEEHKVWIGLEYFCKENDDFWNLSEEECLKFATEELRSIGIVNQDSVVEAYCREKVKKLILHILTHIIKWIRL